MENKPTQLASLMHPTSRTVYELASAKPPPSEEYKALLRHHRDALAPAADLMSEDLSFTARERAVLIFGVSCGLCNGEGESVQDTLASFQVPRPPACGRLRFVRLARWSGGGLGCLTERGRGRMAREMRFLLLLLLHLCQLGLRLHVDQTHPRWFATAATVTRLASWTRTPGESEHNDEAGMEITGTGTGTDSEDMDEAAKGRPTDTVSYMTGCFDTAGGGGIQTLDLRGVKAERQSSQLHSLRMFSPCKERYEMVKLVGEDLTAVAKHRETGDAVMVRLVKDAMAGGDSSLGLVRELRMMRHLRGHDNVSQVSENTARFGASVAAQLVRPPPSVPTDTSPFVEQVRDLVEAPPGRGAFKDIYIVTQLDTSLDRVLADQQLTEACVGAFAHQILRGLKYLHSADIIHGDLKPSVLRVSASGQLRISDIGHARLSDGDDFNTYYGVVKMYRAPEVLLAAREHGKPIDTWSVGCILAEMIAHKKLFDSNHPVATIKLQLEKVGFPKPEDQQHLPAVARKRLMDLGPVQPSPGWKKLLPQVPPRGGLCACASVRAPACVPASVQCRAVGPRFVCRRGCRSSRRRMGTSGDGRSSRCNR